MCEYCEVNQNFNFCPMCGEPIQKVIDGKIQFEENVEREMPDVLILKNDMYEYPGRELGGKKVFEKEDIFLFMRETRHSDSFDRSLKLTVKDKNGKIWIIHESNFDLEVQHEGD